MKREELEQLGLDDKQIESIMQINKTDIESLKKEHAVEAAITGAKGKNAKAIKALLNLDNAELADDGSIKGLSEQLEALVKAEDSKFLFDTATKQVRVKGATIGEGKDGLPGAKISTKDMSYKQIEEYLKLYPDAIID